METEIEKKDNDITVVDDDIEKNFISHDCNEKKKMNLEENVDEFEIIDMEKEINIDNASKAIGKLNNTATDGKSIIENDDIATDGKSIIENDDIAIITDDDIADSDFNERNKIHPQVFVDECEIIQTKEEEKTDNKKLEDIITNKNNTSVHSNESAEKIAKKALSLVADYRSASESESDLDSVDSESDSSSEYESVEESESESESESDTDTVTDSETDPKPKEANKKKQKKKSNTSNDLSFIDLPPIEDLKISVPEDECEEIGTISSIVETLVVIECYKGIAPLDIDSVLFLDKGKRALGKVFDVIGPVSEPVYTVRFTDLDQIKKNEIESGMKVFCAPKTDYASYVFLPDLLKMKGSDASWKDNCEPPPECQDFSDDEEEQKFKNPLRNVHNENNRRRNPDGSPQDFQKRVRTWKNHNNIRPSGRYINPSRFQNTQQFQSPNFTAPLPWSYQPPTTSSQQSSPSYPSNPFARAAGPMYPNNTPFSSFRFPNIPPFSTGNFVFNTPPPPPPPPPGPSALTSNNSYPTRMTGPPPFSSFTTPPPGNRMPGAPFSFGQGFAQQPNIYSQQMQLNYLRNAQNAHRLPIPMSRTFGSDVRGPPPPPPSG